MRTLALTGRKAHALAFEPAGAVLRRPQAVLQVPRYHFALSRRARAYATIVAVGAAAACTPRASSPAITGDWDAYLASGSTARPGFEGWRRIERRRQSIHPRRLARRHAHGRDARRGQAGRPADSSRAPRHATPFVVESQYALWPGAVSDSQYTVTEDTLVFMKTRDGARLASSVARPVGKEPFGVVLQRTPLRRARRNVDAR